MTATYTPGAKKRVRLKPQKRDLHVRVREDLLDELQDYQEKTEVTLARVVTEAIEYYADSVLPVRLLVLEAVTKCAVNKNAIL